MVSANIILTYRCVNRCPYCFSSKTLNRSDDSDLSKEGFLYYLDFLKRSKKHDVRLLGGEPFIHPHVEEFIQLVLNDGWFEHLTIFTTGFIDSRFHKLLRDKRVNLVVNVNHPNDYPKGRYTLLVEKLVELANLPVDLVIGFNIYREDFDFLPTVKLAQELGCKKLRWTIAVPSSDVKTECLNREQRRRITPRLLEFLQTCVERHLVPVMDCPVEPCIFTDEQLGRFTRLCPNAVPKIGKCSPVIDLGLQYRALRCFASGEALAQDVRDYKTLKDLEKYYKRTIEAYRIYATLPECQNCHYLRMGLCFGGCIAENVSFITELKTKVSNLPHLLLECKEFYQTKDYSGALQLLRSNMDGIILPEILAEYANALLHSQKEKEFVEFMEKYEEKLSFSKIKSVDFLSAKYYYIKKDYVNALCFLRRCLSNVQEAKFKEIKSIITSIENMLKD